MVDGIRLRVAEAGSGPALLLLHGLTATHANWEHTLPAFADRYRVVAPDLPGHGASEKPDAPYSMDFFAGVLRSLARELGIDTAVVAGNSLGGEIAVEMALEYPRFVRGLVLAAPAGGFSRALTPVGRGIEALAYPWLMRAVLPWAVGRSFHDRTHPGYAMRRRMMEERIAHADFPAFVRAVARSIRGALEGGGQPIDRLRLPVLLVWGKNDGVIPYASHQRVLRGLPHARFATFDQCGHLPMLEQSTAFNRELAQFLRVVEATSLGDVPDVAGGS